MVAAARSHANLRYGRRVRTIILLLDDANRVEFPVHEQCGTAVEFVFSLDCRSVQLGADVFIFTDTQAEVVKIFAEARAEGYPSVSQGWILSKIGTNATKLLDLFWRDGKMHRAWNTMIVAAEGSAMYTLAEPKA